MKNLIKHLQNTNHRYSLWNKGEKIIIGVSGGSDSLALLYSLFEISQKENLKLVVAHINYGLRKDSVQDEKLVKNITKKLKIPCEILNNLNLTDKECNENSWRNIRYDFFTRIKTKYQANKIAVAHTKNDQVETFLLHLLRGSGLNGLTAMQYKNKDIIRPFLSIEKKDILQYCQKNKLQYLTDSTNIDTKYLRNKIRLKLIPYLESGYNKQIINILAKTAENITNDYNYLLENQEYFWQYEKAKKQITFSDQDFCNKHISVQRQSLRIMMSTLLGNLKNIENGTIEEFRLLINSQKNKNKNMIAKNLKLTKKNDIVTIVCNENL